ncbi:hypothetical protein ASE69_20890 [Sphingomonas sp. Leaf208]|nr:hypothetical protein ASE69_20890 [Sphingomonas sp. Leaf208]
MHRQTRITVDLVVQILRSTLDQTSPERWPLVMFWEGAQQEHETGRSQSVTALFNGIVRQLRRPGAYSG